MEGYAEQEIDGMRKAERLRKEGMDLIKEGV